MVKDLSMADGSSDLLCPQDKTEHVGGKLVTRIIIYSAVKEGTVAKSESFFPCHQCRV